MTDPSDENRVRGVINARLVIPEIGEFIGGFSIDEGRVGAIWEGTNDAMTGADVIDAGGRYVLPGLIDPHVHLGLLPPLSSRLPAESAFAASGGITTLLHYFRRPESYLETFPKFLSVAEQTHLQDFAVHLTLFNATQVAEMEEYLRSFGVTSFKIYMMLKGALGHAIVMDQTSADGTLEVADVDFNDGHLYEVFRAASKLPARVRISVHAETAEIVMHEIRRVQDSGLGGLAAWHAARPGESEAIAIQEVAYLSRMHNVPVYFPHIGSRQALDALKKVKAEGIDYGAETGPQYLAITIDDPIGVLAKITPPIRTGEDQGAVWDGVASGLLHTMGSDHIPYTNEEKQLGPVWTTRSAFGSIGLTLPVLLTYGVHQKRISMVDVARITSNQSARLFGLYPRKGTLLPGSDADFVVIDPDYEWTVHWDNLLSSSEFSVFEGRSMRGRADITVVRGTVVYRDGIVVGEPGHGNYYRRYPTVTSSGDA